MFGFWDVRCFDLGASSVLLVGVIACFAFEEEGVLCFVVWVQIVEFLGMQEEWRRRRSGVIVIGGGRGGSRGRGG